MTCWLCGSESTELVTEAPSTTCKNGACQICVAVAQVDEEIHEAVGTLERLLAKRCDLRSEQNRVHGTLAHQLPTEVKSHIFEFLGLDMQNIKWVTADYQKKPLPLYAAMRVCRNWRDIVWSNPFFWSTIQIRLGVSSPDSDENVNRDESDSDADADANSDLSSDGDHSPINFELVNTWIARSGASPLTFHVVALERGYSAEEWKGVFNAISRCSNRLETLSLHLPWELIRTILHNNFQCDLLKILRITSLSEWQHPVTVPPSNLIMASPESLEIQGVPFRSLQISWNHLTFAKLFNVDLEDLVRLFQHASQMTCCHIWQPLNEGPITSIPPIIHHRLKTLSFCYAHEADMLLGSLTLPCLQEFDNDDVFHLEHLSALVRRSSCPLTRVKFYSTSSPRGGDLGLFDRLQPLPGVIDLVLDYVDKWGTVVTSKLLLEDYFPDLRHLTLQLAVFKFLWGEGIIPLLLDRARPRLNAASNGRQPKIRVLNRQLDGEKVDLKTWVSSSDLGRQLESLDISWTEDGFEIDT